MTSGTNTTPGVPPSAAAVEQAVIDAIRAASPDSSVPISRDTEVLQVVDSLGLMVSLAKIQAALQIKLEPTEVIGVLRSRSVADITQVLITAMGTRYRQAV
jgi:acyl carrier protein